MNIERPTSHGEWGGEKNSDLQYSGAWF